MVFTPVARLVPFIVRLAAPAEIVAEPRAVEPLVSVTVPEVTAVPAAVFTVMASTVEALDAMVVGVAAIVSVAEAVTVTATVPFDVVNTPIGV